MNISMVPIYHNIKLKYYANGSTTKTDKMYVLSVYKNHCQILKNVQAKKTPKIQVSQNEAEATTKKNKQTNKKTFCGCN